jgi:signal transduction histidine kinase
MFSSLRSRLWLTYALVVGVALGAVTLIFFIYLLRNPPSYRQSAAQLNLALTILDNRNAEWGSLAPGRLQRFLTEQDRIFGIRLLILDSERRILADSRRGESPRLVYASLVRISRLTQVIQDESGARWFSMARRLPDGSYLVAAVPRPAVSAVSLLTDEFLRPVLLAGGIALGLSLLLAFGVARWVADPLQRLVDVAGQFPEKGAKPLPLGGPQEVRELVKAFNQMTTRVQSSQQSQKDFVANVSHELKTPLTSVQGFAQALLDGTADTPHLQRGAAQVIYDEAGRMHRMVLDLLDLARLDAGTLELRRETVDMAALLRGVAEKFAPLADEVGVSIAFSADDLPPLPGDGDRLAQVFTNLVENAIKFTPAGGVVRLYAEPQAEFLQVSVADTGMGITTEAQTNIYERFYQADASRRGGQGHGAGLGLAIVAEIVRAHGGKISVQSSPGQGSVFLVSLPFVSPDASTLVRKKR